MSNASDKVSPSSCGECGRIVTPAHKAARTIFADAADTVAGWQITVSPPAAQVRKSSASSDTSSTNRRYEISLYVPPAVTSTIAGWSGDSAANSASLTDIGFTFALRFIIPPVPAARTFCLDIPTIFYR
ncbi:hypothetical protein OOK31_18810 [Streptomyces sp. NBC_00249]|nr:hypothetical protein [Streptomyces sp. NBC_00249]